MDFYEFLCFIDFIINIIKAFFGFKNRVFLILYFRDISWIVTISCNLIQPLQSDKKPGGPSEPPGTSPLIERHL